MRLERAGPISPQFSASASSLSGPGFSVIELRNGAAAASWNANPGLNDLRLAYFVQAPSASYDFAGEAESMAAPRVQFLDLTRGGAFRAPGGMHIIQLNLDRTGLELDGPGLLRLAGIGNLVRHPVLRSLLMPVLLSCRAPGMEAHAAASGAVLRSAVTALAASLLAVPAAPDSLEPSQRRGVQDYLRRNYASGNLSSEAIAGHFHMSRRTLFSLFEGQELGLGAHIRLLRTARALELLREPHWRLQPVDRIASGAGFTSSQALRRALKEATGLGVRDLRDDRSALEAHLAALRRVLGA